VTFFRCAETVGELTQVGLQGPRSGGGGTTERLLEYGAISDLIIRNERYDTTVLGGTTSALDISRELDGELLRFSVRRCLGDMGEYEG
jgi:hypothetical protein